MLEQTKQRTKITQDNHCTVMLEMWVMFGYRRIVGSLVVVVVVVGMGEVLGWHC